MVYFRKNFSIKRDNKNNLLSYWPYLAPVSCISFRRKFIKKFIKKNLLLEKKYPDVWLDFRLGAFSYYEDKSFCSYNENILYLVKIGLKEEHIHSNT